MNHPDEHTLELFVVGAGRIRSQRAKIESHVRQCQRCRDLVCRIRDFYEAVEQTSRDAPAMVNHHSTALARTIDMRRKAETRRTPGASANLPVLGRIFTQARRHPAVAVTSSTGVLVLTLLLSLNTIERLARDPNPAYVQFENAQSTLAVYNSADVRLWEKPTWLMGDLSWFDLERIGIHYAVVTDLDGDGMHEVVSTLPFRGMDENAYTDTVRIFSSTKTLLSSSALGRNLRFGARDYPSRFGLGGIIVWEGATGRQKEILVSECNFWSPSSVTRISAHGEIIGQYWHFGHISRMFRVKSMGPQQRDCLLLMARNDVQDSVGREFAVLAVIDPSRIFGPTESTGTPGFGFGRSTAEVFYIHIPLPDVAALLEQQLIPDRITQDNNGSIHALFTSSPVVFSMEYSFSDDMRLAGIKPVDGFERIHRELLKEGRIRSQLGREYFDQLRRETMYWNGRQWQREVTEVRY